jgi:hypothetical protein
MPDDTNAPDQTDAPTFSLDEMNARINAAVATHIKRAMGGIEKTIAETVARSLQQTTQQQPAAEHAPAQGQDPAAARYQLAQQQKQLEDERAARRQTEDRARTDRVHGELRSHLQRHLRPELLDAAHLMLRTNAMRIEEDGTPVLTVKRARAKGADAMAVDYTEIDKGVADWLQSEDAKPFLPAPKAAVNAAQGRTLNGRAPTYDKPTNGPQEAAARTVEALMAAGVDPLAAIGR